jgi:hypothetical protein
MDLPNIGDTLLSAAQLVIAVGLAMWVLYPNAVIILFGQDRRIGAEAESHQMGGRVSRRVALRNCGLQLLVLSWIPLASAFGWLGAPSGIVCCRYIIVCALCLRALDYFIPSRG